MKKILFLLAILFCSLSFGQGWNTTVSTSINESSLEKMDLFTNKDGNHLLIKRTNGNIVYYNFNSVGTVNTNKTVTFDYDGDFPNIVGSNDIVYALYKSGDYITGKYSTNGGSGWSDLPNDKGTTGNYCNGIDAIYQDQLGVHLVWATMDDNDLYETYYSRLRLSDYQWVDNKTITDYSGYQDGSEPKVTFSSGRVHVSFTTAYGSQTGGYVRTRDKDNTGWLATQEASDFYSFEDKIVVSGNYLYMISVKSNIPYIDLVYKSRTLSGSWSGSESTIQSDIAEHFNAIKTYDGNLQLVYMNDDTPADFLHRSYNGSWSSTYTIDPNQDFYGYPKGLSSTSNDFFITWKRYGDNYLRYRQYDAVPLAPQNLAVQVYTNPDNMQTHPKLTLVIK